MSAGDGILHTHLDHLSQSCMGQDCMGWDCEAGSQLQRPCPACQLRSPEQCTAPQDFREPLYLTDKPVQLLDNRSEEDLRYPELFKHRLKLAPAPVCKRQDSCDKPKALAQACAR